MLRIVITLALALVWVTPAFAQMSVDDIQDDAKRLDQRHYAAWDRAMHERDFYANIHDTIYHPEYKAAKAVVSRYEATKSALQASLKKKDTSKGMKQLEELGEIGKELDEKMEAYTASSANAVEKIQIGLGVAAFLICGIGVLIYRRLKR
jgi:hypothetical protein